MIPDRILIPASIGFAVAWTLYMIVAMSEGHPAAIAIISVMGAIAGVLWYFGMRWAMGLFHRAMSK